MRPSPTDQTVFANATSPSQGRRPNPPARLARSNSVVSLASVGSICSAATSPAELSAPGVEERLSRYGSLRQSHARSERGAARWQAPTPLPGPMPPPPARSSWFSRVMGFGRQGQTGQTHASSATGRAHPYATANQYRSSLAPLRRSESVQLTRQTPGGPLVFAEGRTPESVARAPLSSGEAATLGRAEDPTALFAHLASRAQAALYDGGSAAEYRQSMHGLSNMLAAIENNVSDPAQRAALRASLPMPAPEA